MSIGAEVWKHRYTSWSPAKSSTPGYSLLMPVPGDLPVFLEIALAVNGRQRHEHRLETLVLPDRDTQAVRNVVERARSGWNGPLEIVPLPLPERWVLPKLNNPAHNYGVQLLTGVNRAQGTHVILHDADLFLLRDDILDEHWAAAQRDGLVCRGVDHVWDPWFAEKGITNMGATWELCAQVNWLRTFPPHMHLGHDAEMFGEMHMFDVTLHPQALSDPAKIQVHDRNADIVHFNYVIGTYRHFQNAKGSFEDDRFRLVLIRLFIDLFAVEPYEYVVPEFAGLAQGLTAADAPVTYPEPNEENREAYRVFRDKLDRILDGDWAPEDKRMAARAAITPFDQHYGWSR